MNNGGSNSNASHFFPYFKVDMHTVPVSKSKYCVLVVCNFGRWFCFFFIGFTDNFRVVMLCVLLKISLLYRLAESVYCF